MATEENRISRRNQYFINDKICLIVKCKRKCILYLKYILVSINFNITTFNLIRRLS